MATLYSTGPIANAPSNELEPQVEVLLLNNDVRATSRVFVTLFSIAGTKRAIEFRAVDLPPQRGRNVVFELGERIIRSYEVQILVDGAENNLLASVWKTTFSPQGVVYAPEKRVLHSELVSRTVPFVPVLPFPPVIGLRELESEAPEGSTGTDDDESSGSDGAG